MSLFSHRRLWALAVLAVGAPMLLLLWRPDAPAPRPPAMPATAAATSAAPGTPPRPAETPPAPPPTPAQPSPAPAPGVAPVPLPAITGVATPPGDASAQPDLDAALAIADAARRSQEFFPKFAALVARDFEAALAYLRSMRRGQEFTQGLFILIDQVSRRDPDRALALALDLATNRDERNVFAMLFSRFAQENVALALERLRRLPAGESREAALRSVLDAWVRTAPEAAAAWAKQLPDPAERSLALESILRDLAARDPAAAIAQAQAALSGASLERVLQFAFQVLAATDPARASQLLDTIPPGDVQTIAVMDVARAMAVRNLEQALAWAQSLPIDFTRWLALSSVLSVWAQKDPLAAASHVMAMPPGPALDYVAGQFAAVMAAKPSDAILWAEALPSRSARDAAFVTIASTWAQRAPLDALRWADKISGEPVRTNALAGAHSTWRLHDPRAAQTWLDAAPYPPAFKSRLLAPR